MKNVVKTVIKKIKLKKQFKKETPKKNIEARFLSDGTVNDYERGLWK